jgi:class 3 adenylate cyclase/tetratricopeptide (TPR) repeat protein
VSAVPTAACTACGAQTPAGKRFCINCGSPVQASCRACGEPVLPGAKFCAECGAGLGAESGPARTAGARAPAGALSERRLVSVLFADLVGFTTLSEHRDPEKVRELLSSYFDRCRTVIERYGGTVEKFIGDAVMAVWGTPVAREDDAERAVRAALALTPTVGALGEEVGVPALKLRAGVLTGNAAVDVGAEGEGMVLGDSVNTASRLQSIAAPGTVLVDDATRRASEAAIAYEDAGVHEVKGREQPVHAWTALRVVAGVSGARRLAGLEAPFIGRERELQEIIEAGEESARKGQARHVCIVGDPGSGKARLLWEYFKYLDGIEQVRFWHQGRCLSYGEGVAYWALAEMVRGRARIQEEEDPKSARAKLHTTVEEFVSDERERRLVEPRLGHLLRLEERPDSDRVDLFSGWRLFFERLSQQAPVVLAFQDLEWADSGLLEFIDYLLEWSAGFPIFVITFGRPELLERRPSWQPLLLGPLMPQAITDMLEALAPGLPEQLVAQIVERSEGIPLYAVETIRMLQDRGVLVQEGARYHVAGEISDLEVPETLHALVASRLDGLPAGERSLLQDASILGQSFTAAAAAALSGQPKADVERLLDGLVTKQLLSRDEDTRSPEYGQYAFLQGLLRTVAYGTLSRRARKAKHVAAARQLEQTWPGEVRDIAEVVASHYLEAIRADPEADDVAWLRATAREKLTAAGQAAASLALGPEADRYFSQAAELAEEDLERADLFEQAGRAMWHSGNTEAAEERLGRAVALYKDGGRATGGRAAVALAALLRYVGRMEEGRALLERFRFEEDADRVGRAEALTELAAVLVFAGELAEADPLLEQGLRVLELEQAWPALANGLVHRGIYLIFTGRRQEGEGVLRQALGLAEKRDLPAIALRARVNLAQLSIEDDRFSEAVEELEEGLAIARQRGDRLWERQMLGQGVAPLCVLGRWDDAMEAGVPLIGAQADLDATQAAAFLVHIAAARGDEEVLRRCVWVAEQVRGSTYVDLRVGSAVVLARDALERRAPEDALAHARDVLLGEAFGAEEIESVSWEAVETIFALGVQAALAVGEERAIAELEGLVARMPPARATPLVRAGRARLQAELAHHAGDEEAAGRFEHEAIELLRFVGAAPLLAQALLERARRHGDSEALAEARAIYEQLGAVRWLERIADPSEVAA